MLQKNIRKIGSRVKAELKDLIWDGFMSIPLHFLRRVIWWLLVPLSRDSKGVMLNRHVRVKGYKGLKVGNNVFVNRNVLLDGRGGLEIGDSCDIGEYVKIWSLEHDPNDNSHKTRAKKTVIGDHVWIAPWSIIMPGVTIGRGAVVGGGSIVTKDVPPKSIVAGVPAKQIGKRENKLDYSIKMKLIL